MLARDNTNYEKRLPGNRNFPVAAGQRIFYGAVVSIAAADGLLRRGRSGGGFNTDKVVGVALFGVDTTNGANSAVRCEVESDFVIPMLNSGGSDAITLANVGDPIYLVDDNTVALTDGGGTRPRAGLCNNVTERGVWLRFEK